MQLERVQVLKEQDNLAPLVDESGRGRLPHAVLRAMRRGTGADLFPTLVEQLLSFGMGTFEGFAGGDPHVVAKALGLPDSDGLEEQPRATSHAYDPRRFREALEHSSLEELEAARDEVRAVLELSDTLLAMAGIDSRFSQPVAIALRRPDLDSGLYLVLFRLSVRRSPWMREVYEAALSLVRAVAKGVLSPADALEADLDQNPEESSNE